MKQKIISSTMYQDYPFIPSGAYNHVCFIGKTTQPGWLASDFPVAEEVTDLVSILQKEFGQDVPLTLLEDFSHGSLGQVLHFINERTPEDSFHNPFHRLIARVSYGSGYGKEGPDWDMTNFQRMHLSVTATKTFRPLDEIVPLVKENIHFTIRWDGKDQPEGVRPFDDQTSDYPHKEKWFHPMRMAFYQAGERKIPSDTISDKFISQFPVARRSFDLTTKHFGDVDTRDATPPFYGEDFVHHRGGDFLPEVGYEAILKALSRFGPMNESDVDFLRKSTVEQGIAYFTEKVVPTMKRYALSEEI